MAEPVEVTPWTGPAARRYHDEVVTAWLHGSVAVIHSAGRLLLVVPVVALTPAIVALALRLHAVGSVTELD